MKAFAADAVLFDFRGTLDTDGIHWCPLLPPRPPMRYRRRDRVSAHEGGARSTCKITNVSLVADEKG
jgi:hypothetical protein